MQNLYTTRVINKISFINALKITFFSFVAITALICVSATASMAQQKKLERQSILALEGSAQKTNFLKVGKDNTATVNPIVAEMERERKKALMTSAERVLAAKAMMNRNLLSPKISTDGLTIFNGTLSVADPAFNRTLSIAQGGACSLSGVGTAVHYKTHSFTLPGAGNVTISFLPADGATITPGTADTFLELYGPGGFVPAAACTNFIASNDDAAGSLSKIVTTTPLAAGTYTIVVTSFDNTPTDFPWTYGLALITPAVAPCPNAILYGYNFNNDHLISFNANTPGTLLTDIALTGFNVGEFLIGIDFRPADGLLYGLATDGVDDRVVLINTATGALTGVGGITVPTTSGIFFGMDFNPVVDRIRNVDDGENNRRFNPTTGALVATDGALAYAPADPGFGTNPSVVHVAYDRNNVGATLTTLYGIDAVRDVLVAIGGINGVPSPNTGVLTTIGALGVNTTSFGGFDIEPNSDQAYASLRIAGVSQLFTINLSTGAATLVGNIGSGTAIDGLAISPVCVTCIAPTITTQPSNVTACAGTSASFTVAVSGTSPAFQWQVNTGSGFNNLINGAPYSNVTTATLTINPVSFSMNGYLYRCVITNACGNITSSSGGLTINQVVHSAALATPAVMCAPGATTITGTATLGAGNYTHTLTGPGTIVQNPSTGPNNSIASFAVSAIPAGTQTYILTSTDAIGCQAISNVIITVNPVPVITFTPAAPAICNGAVQPITASVAPPVPQLVTGGGVITINDNTIANPYPSNIIVSGLPATGVSIKSVTINGLTHTFPGDIDMVLQSPSGANVILMSDAGSGTAISNAKVTFDDAAATTITGAIVSGTTYKPTNTAGPDNFPAPGPGSITQVAPALASFGAADYNGLWKLFVVDDANGDFGTISDWNITFNIPVPVTYSPVTNLFTDAAATIAYTGTPVFGNIYTKPSATSTYTAMATRNGCAGTANVTVTINQLPAITTQPTPATQTVCPGSAVTYTVAATGAGLTYQWRRNAVALVNGVQASGSTVAGATTNTLTISNVLLADAGNYDVVVSGTCPPTVTSAAVALVIATAPTITAQPANVTACDGGAANFSVVATSSPGPTTYQWQVSTVAVPAFTSLLIPSASTAALTLSNVTIGMSGNKYRVVIANSCGQAITSNGLATLTVNTVAPVTVTALPARICLSDGPVALVGSPVGGSWSGIGVSGSNFVPAATAVGTYTLTYTFINSLGCPASATVVAKVVSDAECGRLRLLRDNAVLLYPNPTNGNFNIRINSILYNYLNMRVYNAAGNIVNTRNYTGLVYGQVVPVDLSHLPSGTYMVRFFYDDGARTAEKVFPLVIGRQ